jgi:HEPN domain-containing protein
MRRREPRDLALLLLSKAEDDETAVRELLDNAAVTNSIVGFHAEQTAEKSLKAVLSSRRVEYPRTHNIAALLDLLHEAKIEVPQWAEDLRLLTPFGVATRQSYLTRRLRISIEPRCTTLSVASGRGQSARSTCRIRRHSIGVGS